MELWPLFFCMALVHYTEMIALEDEDTEGYKSSDHCMRMETGIGWTSGSWFDPVERGAVEDTERARIDALRADKRLPKVFFDIAIKSMPIGRVEMVLFSDIAPLAAENFRVFCTGDWCLLH